MLYYSTGHEMLVCCGAVAPRRPLLQLQLVAPLHSHPLGLEIIFYLTNIKTLGRVFTATNFSPKVKGSFVFPNLAPSFF